MYMRVNFKGIKKQETRLRRHSIKIESTNDTAISEVITPLQEYFEKNYNEVHFPISIFSYKVFTNKIDNLEFQSHSEVETIILNDGDL